MRAKSGNEEAIGTRNFGTSTTSTTLENRAAGPAAISTATGPRTAGRRRPSPLPSRRRARPPLLAEARRRRTDLPLRRTGASAAAGSRRDPAPATPASGAPGSPDFGGRGAGGGPAAPEHRPAGTPARLPGPTPRRGPRPPRARPVTHDTGRGRARPHRFVSRIGRRIAHRIGPHSPARAFPAGRKPKAPREPSSPAGAPAPRGRARTPPLPCHHWPMRGTDPASPRPASRSRLRAGGRRGLPFGGERPIGSGNTGPPRFLDPESSGTPGASPGGRTGRRSSGCPNRSAPRARDGRVSGPASGARTGSSAPPRTPAR